MMNLKTDICEIIVMSVGFDICTDLFFRLCSHPPLLPCSVTIHSFNHYALLTVDTHCIVSCWHHFGASSQPETPAFYHLSFHLSFRFTSPFLPKSYRALLSPCYRQLYPRVVD